MNILYDYALSFVGRNYNYGGPSLILGTDCSGFICELLRSVGIVGKDHLSSQMLYDKFEQNWGRNTLMLGSVCFYGKDVKNIEHVSMMIDQYRVIECGGGDHTTTDIKSANDRNAMVRIRHTSWRKDCVAILRPNYATIGVIK